MKIINNVNYMCLGLKPEYKWKTKVPIILVDTRRSIFSQLLPFEARYDYTLVNFIIDNRDDLLGLWLTLTDKEISLFAEYINKTYKLNRKVLCEDLENLSFQVNKICIEDVFAISINDCGYEDIIYGADINKYTWVMLNTSPAEIDEIGGIHE